MRRIGVLSSLAADDPEGQARIAAFLRELQQLGWGEGHNVRIEFRWGTGDADRIRRDAAELVAFAPDVILAAGGRVMVALREVTRSVPIVFTQTADPLAIRHCDLIIALARGNRRRDLPSMPLAVWGKLINTGIALTAGRPSGKHRGIDLIHLNDAVSRQTSPHRGLTDGLGTFCLIEAIGLPLISAQK